MSHILNESLQKADKNYTFSHLVHTLHFLISFPLTAQSYLSEVSMSYAAQTATSPCYKFIRPKRNQQHQQTGHLQDHGLKSKTAESVLELSRDQDLRTTSLIVSAKLASTTLYVV